MKVVQEIGEHRHQRILGSIDRGDGDLDQYIPYAVENINGNREKNLLDYSFEMILLNHERVEDLERFERDPSDFFKEAFRIVVDKDADRVNVSGYTVGRFVIHSYMLKYKEMYRNMSWFDYLFKGWVFFDFKVWVFKK